MLHAPGYMFHVPCSLLPTPCSLLPAPCPLLQAPSSTLQAPCVLPHTPCSCPILLAPVPCAMLLPQKPELDRISSQRPTVPCTLASIDVGLSENSSRVTSVPSQGGGCQLLPISRFSSPGALADPGCLAAARGVAASALVGSLPSQLSAEDRLVLCGNLQQLCLQFAADKTGYGASLLRDITSAISTFAPHALVRTNPTPPSPPLVPLPHTHAHTHTRE